MSNIKATDLQSKVLNFHNKVLNPAKNTLGPQIPETAFSDRMSTAIRQVAKAQEEASISAKNFELGIENDLSKVNLAFFTTNGVASVIFGFFVIYDLLIN